MPLSADSLLDRIRLKSEVVKWRSLAILAVTLLAASLFAKSINVPSASKTDYIARISIEGIILEDRERDEQLKQIKDNKNIKAIIVYINSPGGTMVGGETIYHSLLSISEVKPVVAVMGSVAASGGYMAAIAAEHVLARAGTITGSIGVMMQSAEITELSKKLGVNFLTFKSGDMKGSPSPFEKLEPKAKDVVNAGIQDSYEYFLNMVKTRRELNNQEVAIISDGRIFTGRQALENNLIDEIGGEDEARKWLATEHKIDINTPVKEFKLKKEKIWLEKIYSKITGPDFLLNNGIMALWNPSVI